jgi:hypothetical protein
MFTGKSNRAELFCAKLLSPSSVSNKGFFEPSHCHDVIPMCSLDALPKQTHERFERAAVVGQPSTAPEYSGGCAEKDPFRQAEARHAAAEAIIEEIWCALTAGRQSTTAPATHSVNGDCTAVESMRPREIGSAFVLRPSSSEERQFREMLPENQ